MQDFVGFFSTVLNDEERREGCLLIHCIFTSAFGIELKSKPKSSDTEKSNCTQYSIRLHQNIYVKKEYDKRISWMK